MTVFNKTQKQIITIFLKKLLKASVFSIKKEAELEPGSPFQIFKTLFSSVVRAVQGCLLLFSILGKNNKGTKPQKLNWKTIRSSNGTASRQINPIRLSGWEQYGLL